MVISYSITGRAMLQYQSENGLLPKLTLEQADTYFDEMTLAFSKNIGSILKILHDFDKLGFKLEDAFLSTEEMQKNWIKNNSESDLSLADELRTIQSTFDQIKLNAFKIDKTLEKSTESAKAKTNHLIENLERKIFRAEKRKHEVSLKQIENVKNRLFPSGTLQERVVNLAPMFVNYGDDFISSLIENFEPLGGDFTLLLPSS